MRKRASIAAPLAVLAALAVAAPAGAAQNAVAPARGFAPQQVVVKFAGERYGHAIAVSPGVGVRRAARALRRNPRVAYAEPNYIATASAFGGPLEIPNDPGTLGGASEAATVETAEWPFKQWNFLPWSGLATPRLPISAGGIDAVGAWRNLIAADRPGAEGVTVAVLDTGVAYRNRGQRFRRSPDFAPGQFVRGRDFIDGDRLPLDHNGHGTHVAATIGEKTDNGTGLTGLAYRAKLMPIRVLDRNGRGRATAIAAGIRWAVSHHAQVINMSFNFDCGKPVPVVDEALREAYAHGVVTVASIGNIGSEECVAPPATGPRVIGVGGSTEGGCLGDYSLSGRGVDLLAPGGGPPIEGCASSAARPIYQVTLRREGNPRSFGIPGDYEGTSMAAAHVSGVAAMVLASGVLGKHRKPRARVKGVTKRLRRTARDIGLPRNRQGAGLIDAGRATLTSARP